MEIVQEGFYLVPKIGGGGERGRYSWTNGLVREGNTPPSAQCVEININVPKKPSKQYVVGHEKRDHFVQNAIFFYFYSAHMRKGVK